MHIRHLNLLLATVLVGGSALSAETALPSVDELVIDRITWSGELAAGSELVVSNPYGDVRLRSAKDSLLALHAVAQRLDTTGDRLVVDVIRRGEQTWVTVTYPPGTEPDPERIAGRERLDRIDLALHVPKGVSVSARTADGLIDAKKMQNDVAARTLGGNIKISTKRGARAETRSGRIDVLLLETSWPRPVVVQTETGDVTVEVPPEAVFELHVETGGEIAPLPWQHLEQQRVAGQDASVVTMNVGEGGGRLWIQSGDGRVELRLAPRLREVTPVAAASPGDS